MCVCVCMCVVVKQLSIPILYQGGTFFIIKQPYPNVISTGFSQYRLFIIITNTTTSTPEVDDDDHRNVTTTTAVITTTAYMLCVSFLNFTLR